MSKSKAHSHLNNWRPNVKRNWQLSIRLIIWQWRFVLIAAAAGLTAMSILQTFAPAEPPQSTVLFAARNLPVGTTLSDDDLKPATLPTTYAAGLVTDSADLLGRVTITGVVAGAPIWLSGVSNADLGGVAPPGTSVVPVQLDAVTTSVLIPGDRVDLVAVSSEGPTIIAQSALVLPPRLDAPTGGAGGGSGLFASASVSVPVTLVAVNPSEAPRVASAAHLNQVTAILIP